MIEAFETGKYYRWVGPHEKVDPMVNAMEFILDGKPRRCLYADVCFAEFAGSDQGWWWPLQYFVVCGEHLNLDFSKEY